MPLTIHFANIIKIGQRGELFTYQGREMAARNKLFLYPNPPNGTGTLIMTAPLGQIHRPRLTGYHRRGPWRAEIPGAASSSLELRPRGAKFILKSKVGKGSTELVFPSKPKVLRGSTNG